MRLNAATSNPGFTLEGGVLVEVDAGMARLSEAETRVAYARILERLRALPDVRAASAASIVPFGPARDGRLVRHHDATAGATFTVVTSAFSRHSGSLSSLDASSPPSRSSASRSPWPSSISNWPRACFPGGLRSASSCSWLAVTVLTERRCGSSESCRRWTTSERRERTCLRSVRPSIPRRDDVPRADGARAQRCNGRAREVLRGVDERPPVLAVRTMTAHRGWDAGSVRHHARGDALRSVRVDRPRSSAIGLYGLRAYFLVTQARASWVSGWCSAPRAGALLDSF